ncbi:MAG TPA: hypothetical protein PLV25_06335 [Opitutales bacterium]|nr:hypothetical protein [Opitutales bacterium]
MDPSKLFLAWIALLAGVCLTGVVAYADDDQDTSGPSGTPPAGVVGGQQLRRKIESIYWIDRPDGTWNVRVVLVTDPVTGNQTREIVRAPYAIEDLARYYRMPQCSDPQAAD